MQDWLFSRRMRKATQRGHVAALLLTTGIALVLTTGSFALGQTVGPVKGMVVTETGQPIAGVSVYAHVWKQCCSAARYSGKTDQSGEFALEHGGSVVHFWKEGLEPVAVVVKPGTSELRVIMKPERDAMRLPICSRPGSGLKSIGWGKFGLHFTVPKKGVAISGGKSDVDYIKYVIRPDGSSSYLALWFGVNAMLSEPGDDQLLESVHFWQRNLELANGEPIGMDSWGQTENGLKWRQTGLLNAGAVYRDADQASASVFDKIINSACFTDYPKQ